MIPRFFDINSDMGEAANAKAVRQEDALMAHVSSINIACGGHVGDTQSMTHCLEAAHALGVAVGAHPSYVDRAGFGRRELGLGVREIETLIAEQTDAFCELAAKLGVQAGHIKLHGALAHRAAQDIKTAEAVIRAIKAVDKNLILLAMAGGDFAARARDDGLGAVEEIFADRAYGEDGRLVPRSEEGALITDAEKAAQRAKTMIEAGAIITATGAHIPARMESLCVHSDTEGSTGLASACRKVLEGAGIIIRPFTHSDA